MVRAKGGKRQPRYYYLKESGEIRLITLMEKEQKTEKLSRVEQLCKDMLRASKELDVLIAAIKAKLEKK